ncbi:hypothetical protein A3A20_01125 [Candidatus Wolfebacteria bacterium RIFCSPLOWO2_01_FULL_45_19]|uniref:Uncharacterized protein n=1 Tax=Candidatus Wolfebacteria bacterium RIFCSPLOWO2_01_FULL_45_19 TaxID=1802557 RepID=A0A1F8DSC0_9BACT|nr:MAG: hypothetical protein UX23_C0004G0008 [Parcubacteria group bacterium GW2011_GWB1_45_9]OGM91533.1 MAG: hypothetical protein A3A20_01125 [Candidatus Wolfebacteria bacterium RIFCSPLOWO2_01_FULL_45_19]
MSKKNRANGDETELKVDRALQILTREWDEVVSYHHSSKNGELDVLHTDFLIFLRSRMAFPLQVKSSSGGARQHIKRYHYITVIAVRRNHDERHISSRIRALILRYYRDIRLRSAEADLRRDKVREGDRNRS